MRTKTLLCLAALTAGALTTMAQSNVYSLNIVGYVNLTNNPGFTMIANPLNATNNSNSQLFSTAPAFTKIIRYQGGAYQTYVNDPDDGWTGPGGIGDVFNLNPGEGVFIQIPAGPSYVKTFVGEVQLNSTNSVPSGFSMRASVIPQAGRVQTDLLYPAANFDKVIKWTGSAYDTYVLDPDDGWTSNAGPGEPTLKVAEGFFAQKTAPANWIRNFVVGP
jgi:hypothetical protein